VDYGRLTARAKGFVRRSTALLLTITRPTALAKRRSLAHEAWAAGSSVYTQQRVVQHVNTGRRRNIRFVALKDYGASLSRRQSSHRAIRFVYARTSVSVIYAPVNGDYRRRPTTITITIIIIYYGITQLRK